MEPVKLDHDGNSIPEASLKQLDSLSSAEMRVDANMESRVGNQYQAEIPPMITEAEQLQLLTNPLDLEVMSDVSHMFLIGLPIPIVWVLDEVNRSEDNRRELSNEVSVGSGNSRRGHVVNLKRKSSNLKAKLLITGLEHKKDLIPVNLEPKVEQISKSFYPLPGSVSETWSDADENSFLLGLYIYGKNFVRVMKFMDKKEMGEILSFYYGKFYKSDGCRRWSDSRHTRSRKYVNGNKIFTGWRQQELLSRLLPHVPEESKKNLAEVSKAFAEGNTSLDAYISFLKCTVGIQVLVEAVDIGKGKGTEDLTGLASDSALTKKHFPVCPKIPTGQACSYLTPSEISNFLTGGYRLSKARCNDIFWEAVWPRLLARGWHSEQPKNRGLVFLMPGVFKFAKRKLVKGIHYLDSVTDVLSKVASEPQLVELETRVEENMDDQCHHCYLKPTRNANLMNFSVVDTSDGKMRGLRPLTLEFKRTSENEGYCSEDETNLDSPDGPSSAEKKTVISFIAGRKTSQFGVLRYSQFVDKHGPEAAANKASNVYKFTVVDTSGGKFRELRYLPVDLTHQLTRLGGNSSDRNRMLEKWKNAKSISDGCDSSQSTSDVKQPKVGIKFQFSRRTNSDDLSWIAKRRRLEVPDASNNGPLEKPESEPVMMMELENKYKSGNGRCRDAVEQGYMNPRTQSTRSRPLTAKALEALANGFLNTSEVGLFSNPL